MDKYDDLMVIGQGQYGTAYRARDKKDGQLYCVKRIPMSAKDDHAGALREAQLLDSLDHPNIIRYRESFVDKDGSLCIVTSFCEEGDLFNRIRKKAAAKEFFREDEVMNMFVQTASAISYIHSKRILHRDLKTQNIFIARGGIIKLGDFGISKVLERTDSFATTVTGTPYYMAPEICTNQPYTYKSDIWSLGCVLYELCTLKHAFAADSLLSLVYQIVRGNFPPIPTDQFSPGLSDLVNKLLARDAASRPSLGEVFKMPYVQRHLDRFKAEEQRRNLKQTTSMSRRKQLLEAGGMPGAGAGGGVDDAALTPKQRLEKKKELDRQRRELELKLASMAATKNRETAAARKNHMIYGSNTGLPGAQANYQTASASAAARGFEDDDDMPNMGTVRMDGSRGAGGAGAGAGAGGRSIWDMGAGGQGGGGGGGVSPYDRTLPSQARGAAGQQPGANGQRPGTVQGARGAPAPGARPGLGGMAPAPAARPSTSAAPSRGGGGMWGVDDDDDVLTGTVRSGTAGRGMGMAGTRGMAGTASAMERPGSAGRAGGGGAAANQWTFDRTAGMHDDMPNMGTVQLTHGPGQLAGLGARGGSAMDFTVGNRTMTDSPLLGSVNLGNTRNAAPVAGRGAAGGGGGILGSAGAAAAAGGRAVASAGQSPYHNRPAGGAYPNGGGKAHAGAQDEDGYSDDFEDDEDDGGAEVLQQRNRIIQNVDDMAKRAYDGRDSIAAVQERVLHTGAKTDKARMLRQNCEKALGSKFAPIYEYLSRARSQTPAPDEKDVQRRLLDMVGDKSRLQACFMVDQLVFTEQMYA